MGLLGALLTALYAAGGAMLGRYVVMKFGIDHQFPMANILGPAAGGYFWGQTFRKLWGDVVKATQES